MSKDLKWTTIQIDKKDRKRIGMIRAKLELVSRTEINKNQTIQVILGIIERLSKHQTDVFDGLARASCLEELGDDDEKK